MIEKSKELQLYCLTHKLPEYGLVDDKYHTPIHVGKSNNIDKYICDIGDNTGENISKYNAYYRELTGIYWIWKNVNDIKYVGTEHYRRRWALDNDSIINALNIYDILTPHHISVGDASIKDLYSSYHSKLDALVLETLLDNSPYFNNCPILLPANCFIAKKEIFNEACEFVFNKLDKFIDIFGGKDYLLDKGHIEEHLKLFSSHNTSNGLDWLTYQRGIFGFLSERIFTVFFLENMNKYKIGHIELKNLEI